MAPFDSAHQIGVYTFSRQVLTIDQGVCRWGFKNRDLRNVFASTLGTSRDTGKRMVPLDSAHQIDLSTFFGDIPSGVRGPSALEIKIPAIGIISHVYIYISTAKHWIVKLRPPFDWPCRISLNPPSNGIPSLV